LGACGGVAEAGFVLNGGIGFLSRKYGLGLDSVRSLRIVLADGSVKKVSATKNPDLFFALRGAGGGNFGVVTELEYLMHKSQDTQLAGTATMAYEDLGPFFQTLGENDKDIPGEIFIYFENPAAPLVLVSWIGPDDVSLEAGKKYLEEDLPAMMPFNVTITLEPFSWTESTRTEGNLEGNLAQAWNGFLHADNNTLSVWNDIMGHVVAAAQASDYLIPDIELWGGAIGSIDPGETAFPHRGALFNVGVLLLVPKDTVNATEVYQAEVDKVNAFWSSISQYMDGAYLNYQMESLNETEYPLQYWRDNLDRLVSLKNEYDPTNVFNFPQSLPLAV
jgi:FAD/FMN-containing dehydrogenase